MTTEMTLLLVIVVVVTSCWKTDLDNAIGYWSRTLCIWKIFNTHLWCKYFVSIPDKEDMIFSRVSYSRISNVCLSVHHKNPLASQNCSYQPLSLSTIEPINHQAYRPSSLLTIEPIDLWSSFATFKPFGLFTFLKHTSTEGQIGYGKWMRWQLMFLQLLLAEFSV